MNIRCDGCGQYVPEQEAVKVREGRGTGHSESMTYCEERCSDRALQTEANNLNRSMSRNYCDMHEPPSYTGELEWSDKDQEEHEEHWRRHGL